MAQRHEAYQPLSCLCPAPPACPVRACDTGLGIACGEPPGLDLGLHRQRRGDRDRWCRLTRRAAVLTHHSLSSLPCTGGSGGGHGGGQRGGGQRGGGQRGGGQRGGSQRGGAQRGGAQRSGGQRGGAQEQGEVARREAA